MINYFNVPKRLGRLDYLVKNIFLSLIIVVPLVLLGMLVAWLEQIFNDVYYIIYLLILCPGVIFLFITQVRYKIARLHDLNMSGWWVILFEVFPVFILVLLLWPGTKDHNRFGEYILH
jgi:uncharacterized membrane protein YhaH (DUF805 family)